MLISITYRLFQHQKPQEHHRNQRNCYVWSLVSRSQSPLKGIKARDGKFNLDSFTFGDSVIPFEQVHFY